MKKGAIICFPDKAPATWSEADEADFRRQISEYDTFRIVVSQIPSFLLISVGFDMLSDGITDLVITSATFNASGSLTLSDHPCRLPLLGMS